jgi:hypothetical protein
MTLAREKPSGSYSWQWLVNHHIFRFTINSSSVSSFSFSHLHHCPSACHHPPDRWRSSCQHGSKRNSSSFAHIEELFIIFTRPFAGRRLVLIIIPLFPFQASMVTTCSSRQVVAVSSSTSWIRIFLLPTGGTEQRACRLRSIGLSLSLDIFVPSMNSPKCTPRKKKLDGLQKEKGNCIG